MSIFCRQPADNVYVCWVDWLPVSYRVLAAVANYGAYQGLA